MKLSAVLAFVLCVVGALAAPELVTTTSKIDTSKYAVVKIVGETSVSKDPRVPKILSPSELKKYKRVKVLPAGKQLDGPLRNQVLVKAFRVVVSQSIRTQQLCKKLIAKSVTRRRG